MDYIQVGQIVNTHGIKGDVKVLPLTDDVKRFEDLKTVYIGDERLCVEISKVSYIKGNVLLRFKDLEDINKVEKLKGKTVWIDEKDKLSLPKDSYFIHDIIGLSVYLVSGEYLGTVKDVLQPGANDVYVVREKGREYLIPAIRDVVEEINLEQQKITVNPIEGLLE